MRRLSKAWGFKKMNGSDGYNTGGHISKKNLNGKDVPRTSSVIQKSFFHKMKFSK